MTPKEEALVADLCRMIVQSRNYAVIPWQALSVVCDVHEHGSTNVTGYAFTQDPAANRPWQAEMPDPSREFLDTLRALNAAMLERTGAKWKTCLVQVVRDGMKFAIDFEYDREDRWFPHTRHSRTQRLSHGHQPAADSGIERGVTNAFAVHRTTTT